MYGWIALLISSLKDNTSTVACSQTFGRHLKIIQSNFLYCYVLQVKLNYLSNPTEEVDLLVTNISGFNTFAFFISLCKLNDQYGATVHKCWLKIKIFYCIAFLR